MDKSIEPIKWIHKTYPIIYGPIQSVNRFYIQNGLEKRLVILFPGLHKIYCTGGPNTILRFAAQVAATGIKVICISLQVPAFKPAEFQDHLVNELGIDPDVAIRMEACEDKGGIWLNRGDKIMATASWTFPLAKGLAKRCGKARPAYFIQDIEPFFLGLGLSNAWLMETYSEPCLPIINTPLLAEALFNIGRGSFATEQFCNDALIFKPAVDRRLFYPQNTSGGKKILFAYTRLNDQESRNMPELALEAINRMAWEKILKEDEWEVHCFGAPDSPPFRLANGMLTKMLPSLSLEEYARELRSASLGMAFVLSPHPGYMAFELAACGVPVITNTFLNKTAKAMAAFSPLIDAAKPTYDAVTTILRRHLLENITRETIIPASRLNLPVSWDESFQPIIPAFMNWFDQE